MRTRTKREDQHGHKHIHIPSQLHEAQTQIIRFWAADPLPCSRADRQAGSGLAQKGAPHTSQVKLCGLLATILDEVRVFEREARCEYKKMQEEKGQMPKWSFDCRGVYREVRPVMCNKAIFKLHATSLDKKVMRITSEIEIEAMSKQRIDRSNGNSNSREQQHDKHNEAGAGG